jgi:hypothetical protein
MVDGYSAAYYADIHGIATSLNRIANCLEAAEQRVRNQSTDTARTKVMVFEPSDEFMTLTPTGLPVMWKVSSDGEPEVHE